MSFLPGSRTLRRLPWFCLAVSIAAGFATHWAIEKIRERPAVSEVFEAPWKKSLFCPLNVQVSPNGTFLAARNADAGWQNSVTLVWRIGSAKRWWVEESPVLNPFSADEGQIALMSSSHAFVAIYDTATGVLLEKLPPGQCAWGHQIENVDGNYSLVNLSDGRRRTLQPPNKGPSLFHGVSDNARKAVFSSSDKLHFWSENTASWVSVPLEGGRYFSAFFPAPSKDGNLVAVHAWVHQPLPDPSFWNEFRTELGFPPSEPENFFGVIVYDATNGREVTRWPTSLSTATCACFLPDGRLLLAYTDKVEIRTVPIPYHPWFYLASSAAAAMLIFSISLLIRRGKITRAQSGVPT
jgi:hypothetical protein